jgi:hypothetical protein
MDVAYYKLHYNLHCSVVSKKPSTKRRSKTLERVCTSSVVFSYDLDASRMDRESDDADRDTSVDALVAPSF